MLGNFSDSAQLVLLGARDEMLDLNHPYVGTEHLVLSILKNEDDMARRLANYHLTYDNFKKEILKIIGKGSKKSEFFLNTPLLKKVIENALLDAKDNNHGIVMTEHLFSSLLEEGEGIAIRIFIGMGIDTSLLYDEFSSKLIKRGNRRKKKLLVEELGVDLVGQASNNKLDPVVGRDKEINRVIEILCRRKKNNPVLIGDAGVGKTASVEELASRIASFNVPDCLRNVRIISLDMASLIAGTKYRGEFEERFNKLIREVICDGNIILFVDEIHTLVGAGGAEGAIDASNILKPALARGKIRCIGATTIYEYKKYIEKDKALDRRFQRVLVSEPNEVDTVNILNGLKDMYEDFHHVVVSNEIIKRIVSLANKYIFDRYNPDKSIDILDEVCSMVGIRKTDNESKLSFLRNELLDIREKKNAFILDSDVKEAYSYLKKESELENKVSELELFLNSSKKKVTLEDVAMVINQKTNIPIYEIMKDNILNVKKVEDGLKECIIGQDKAIDEIVRVTKRLKLGYSNPRVRSYLFVGPTGVGKTCLAREYAALLVGDSNFIRLDMSEYSDAMAVNKIIGSSPGYVGYDDYHSVLEIVRDKPNCVILLDEIDKAHSSVINLLYQILDEGCIKDAKNEAIYFNHCIIIMTSNLGFDDVRVGFCNDNVSFVFNSLRDKFAISLLNRIDSVVLFNYLNKKNIIKIINKKLLKLRDKYVDFVYSKSLIEDIVCECCYEEYGARKIDKIIENNLENLIIDRMINKDSLSIEHLGECQGSL